MPIPTKEEREECIKIIREKTGFDGEIEFDAFPYLLYDLGYRLESDDENKCFKKLSVVAYSGRYPASFGRWIEKTATEIRDAMERFRKKWNAE